MDGVEDPADSLEIRRLARSIGWPQESALHTSARPTRRFLCATDRVDAACMHRASCYKGSGRSLRGPGSSVFFGRLAFRDGSEYRTMLRMRLLLPPASPDVGDVDGIVTCIVTWRCAANQWIKIQRHILVRDLLLIQFLRRHTPHRIEPEPAVGSLNHHGRGQHGGVRHNPRGPSSSGTSSSPTSHSPSPKLAASPNSHRLGCRPGPSTSRGTLPRGPRRLPLHWWPLDVAVGNPAVVSYRSRPAGHPPYNPPYDPVGAFCSTEHRENAKIYRYRKLPGVDANDPDSCVPFAMDASGRLGARASAFLGRVLADSPCAGARSEFETQLGTAIASLAWARQLLRDAPHH